MESSLIVFMEVVNNGDAMEGMGGWFGWLCCVARNYCLAFLCWVWTSLSWSCYLSSSFLYALFVQHETSEGRCLTFPWTYWRLESRIHFPDCFLFACWIMVSCDYYYDLLVMVTMTMEFLMAYSNSFGESSFPFMPLTCTTQQNCMHGPWMSCCVIPQENNP